MVIKLLKAGGCLTFLEEGIGTGTSSAGRQLIDFDALHVDRASIANGC